MGNSFSAIKDLKKKKSVLFQITRNFINNKISTGNTNYNIYVFISLQNLNECPMHLFRVKTWQKFVDSFEICSVFI